MKSQETFARFLNLVEKIRQDIEARCGYPVSKKLLPKSQQFSLRKSTGRQQYLFAYIKLRVKDMLCKIATKAEWAIKAGVQDSKDHMLPNGYHNIDDEYYWNVKAVDDERYKEIIRALSKICQVR